MTLDLLAWLCTGLVLMQSFRYLPWRRINDSDSLMVYLWVVALLVLMRFAVVALMPGLDVHFLGVALALLMFGWCFGIFALTLATLLTYLLGGKVWLGLGLELVFGAFIPAAAVWLCYSASRVWLPRNPFVYFLAAGFAGGACSVLVAQLGKALVLWLSAHPAQSAAFDSLVLTLPAMMFAEGFFAGGAMTLLAVYRPQWVATFDDRDYLRSASSSDGG